MAGVLMIAMPVDLAATKHALGEHATQAALTGLATEIKMVDGKGAPTSFKVPLSGDHTPAAAALLLVVFLILRRSKS